MDIATKIPTVQEQVVVHATPEVQVLERIQEQLATIKVPPREQVRQPQRSKFLLIMVMMGRRRKQGFGCRCSIQLSFASGTLSGMRVTAALPSCATDLARSVLCWVMTNTMKIVGRVLTLWMIRTAANRRRTLSAERFVKCWALDCSDGEKGGTAGVLMRAQREGRHVQRYLRQREGA